LVDIEINTKNEAFDGPQTAAADNPLAPDRLRPDSRGTTLQATGEPVNGAVQWPRLEMPGELTRENAPGDGAQSSRAFACFETKPPRDAAPDTPVTVHGGHNMYRLLI